MSNQGVKYGLLGGVVVVFYFLLLYFINRDLFFSPLLQWSSLGFYLLFMWQASRVDCAANGVSRDFREILRTPFVVFILINLCYWLFYYGLHLFDKSLIETETLLELNQLKAQLKEGLGDPQQANVVRERIGLMEKDLQNPTPVGILPIFSFMARGAIGGFGLAAGIAAIMRSKN